MTGGLDFSIIVPTYRRPAQLASCLEALAHLDYPRDRFEVLVVDDGSESPPGDLVASFRGRLGLTLLDRPHAGPAAARNAGARRAQGMWLAFMDDDCAPAPGWLRELRSVLQEGSEVLAGGRTVNALPDNVYASASHLLLDAFCRYANSRLPQGGFFPSNNMAMAAISFQRVGGFDENFSRAAGEDREFCARWVHAGYRTTYAPRAVVSHAHELSFRSFWRQQMNYGRGAWRFHRAEARRSDPFRFDPALYVSLLRAPFSEARGLQALLLAGLCALSQGAIVVGMAAERAGQWNKSR
jgi:GT2 family glycosyltransferase